MTRRVLTFRQMLAATVVGVTLACGAVIVLAYVAVWAWGVL